MNTALDNNPTSIGTAPTSPWGKPSNQPLPCSLSSVMDEQLAKDLQQKEESKLPADTFVAKEFELNTNAEGGEGGVENDMLLAQMLQLQFDQEHDQYVRAKEKQCNGTSKVSMSYQKYKAVHPYVENNDEDDYSDDDSSDYENEEDIPAAKGKRSKSGSGGIITKHDAVICGKKNASSVEKFPPAFAAGNVTSKDLNVRLPNNVYNSLKQHSIKEEKYALKLHDKKERATHEHALDSNTRLILYKMVDNQTLDAINGCVSTGKEAVVFHADGGSFEERIFPKECAVKVFKTTLNEFKTRDKYIKDDFRFRDRFSKQNPRKIVRLWAEKEMRNLKRIHAVGVNCPEPLLLRKHLLVMQFIGKDQIAAPKLKDVDLPISKLQEAYNECIKMMHTLFNECHLIHADLSEYNLLWHEGKLWLIDVSQSIEPTHPRGLEFLIRDCTNITKFFKNAQIQEIYTVNELFNYISGLDIKGEHEDFLEQVRDFEKDEEMLSYGMSNSDYPFDYFFNKTTAEAQKQKEDEQNNTDTGS